MMDIQQFALGINFATGKGKEEYWKTLLSALNPELLAGAALHEAYDVDTPFNRICIVSGLSLKSARQMARRLACCPSIIAEVDWKRPYYQFNDLIEFQNCVTIGHVDNEGVVIQESDAFGGMKCSGPKHAAEMDSFLIAAGSFQGNTAEATCREVIRILSTIRSYSHILCFPMDQGISDLFFFADGINQNVQLLKNPNCFAVDSSNRAYLLDPGSDQFEIRPDNLLRFGVRTIVAECKTGNRDRVSQSLNECGIPYQLYDESEHDSFLLDSFSFSDKISQYRHIIGIGLSEKQRVLIARKLSSMNRDAYFYSDTAELKLNLSDFNKGVTI